VIIEIVGCNYSNLLYTIPVVIAWVAIKLEHRVLEYQVFPITILHSPPYSTPKFFFE